MSEEGAARQPEGTEAAPAPGLSGTARQHRSEQIQSLPESNDSQHDTKTEHEQEPTHAIAIGAEEVSPSALTIASEATGEATATMPPSTHSEAVAETDSAPEPTPSAASVSSEPSSVLIEAATMERMVEQADQSTEQDDSDFVPADMEHIVSTGATQDGASSMQALRELVAQARASSGQPREALPPGFGDQDEEPEPSSSSPADAQRGEKRKAETELEELIQTGAGINEVKEAAEKSQHPETKTLLQKALSSISGLVSRRSKPDLDATTSPSAAQPEQHQEQPKAKDEEMADSSDDSDSSSDSASSSGDSSDEDDDEVRNVGVALAGDDDDEDGGPSGSAAPTTKNEIVAPDVEQPAVQEITEAEKQTLRKLGKVHSIVDSVVVIEQDVQQSKQADAGFNTMGPVPVDSTGRQGERQGEYSVLDTGSLLCFEDGKVLGLVFETFGSIHNPMYSIRFPSAAAIDRDLVRAGKAVYYVPAQSTYVLTQLLRSMKGSDASNMWDEEVAEEEMEYSDDEQEAEAKRRAKAIRSGRVDEQGKPIGPTAGRGNKRQKHGSGPSNGPSVRNPANGPSQQLSGQVGIGHGGYGPGQYNLNQRPAGGAPNALPRRNVAAPNLPLPPVSAGAASLGPAFPHGIAGLPPKPTAGLPARPNFVSDPSASSKRPSSGSNSVNASPEPHLTSASRPRLGTADGTSIGQAHGRMPSGAATGLPAKPVDAAAAAAALATSQYRAGPSSPPRPSRSVGHASHAAPASGPYLHQGSPTWYTGSGSAPSSTPASPAPPSQHAVAQGSAYSPGAGASAVQGGHYNPAYAAHWQQSFVAGSASAPPTRPAVGMPWNAQLSYHSPPLHMAPGANNQQPYGSHNGPPGSYGAPHGGSWNGQQSYPGSHYPGYMDASASSQQQYSHAAGATTAASSGNQAHYAPSAQAYGYGSYPSQPASADAFNAYGYGAPANHAAPAPAATGQDSYDPRSPSMSSNGQKQHAAGSQRR